MANTTALARIGNETTLAREEHAPSGALEPRDIEEGFRLATMTVKAGLFGIKTPEDAFARMATGMGLGLKAWQSLRGLCVIHGNVALKADLMMGLCLASPQCEYFRCLRTDDEVALFATKRRGDPETQLDFTMAQARASGLYQQNANYGKYGAAMLRARAISALAKLVYPELMHGLYVPEELEEIRDAERSPPPARRSAPVSDAAPTTDRRPDPRAAQMADALIHRLQNADSNAALDALKAEIKDIAEEHRARVVVALVTRRIGLALTPANLDTIEAGITPKAFGADACADLLALVKARRVDLDVAQPPAPAE